MRSDCPRKAANPRSQKDSARFTDLVSERISHTQSVDHRNGPRSAGFTSDWGPFPRCPTEERETGWVGRCGGLSLRGGARISRGVRAGRDGNMVGQGPLGGARNEAHVTGDCDNTIQDSRRITREVQHSQRSRSKRGTGGGEAVGAEGGGAGRPCCACAHSTPPVAPLVCVSNHLNRSMTRASNRAGAFGFGDRGGGRWAGGVGQARLGASSLHPWGGGEQPLGKRQGLGALMGACERYGGAGQNAGQPVQGPFVDGVNRAIEARQGAQSITRNDSGGVRARDKQGVQRVNTQ